MTLCYPTFSLEDKLNKLNVQTMASSSIGSGKAKNPNAADNIKKQMEKTFLPVSVELGQSTITVSDLIKLEVGDMIMSTRRINDDIEISISGQKKLTGKIGNVEGKKAVKVTGKIKNEDIIDPNVYYYEES
ncbi:MAG: FliM/FliN family flagellar motor switch protein, partial [Candidatus Kapaibacterium sp.]